MGLAALLSARLSGQPASVHYPATPAGRIAAAWVSAFNASDEAPLRAFFAQHADPASLASDPIDARLERLRGTRQHLGTLTVESISPADSFSIVVRARPSAVPVTLSLRFTLTRTPPHRLTGLEISAAEGERPSSLADRAPDRLVFAGNRAVVPIDAEARIAVDVGGRTWRFLFDTGASAVVISPAMRAAIGVPTLATEADGEIVRITDLAMGPLQLTGVTALVHALPSGLDGVVGLPTFRDAQLELSLTQGELRLSRDTLVTDDPTVQEYRSFRAGSPLITTAVTVGERPLDALLDTGNSFALTVPLAVAASLTWQDRRPGPLLGGPGIAPRRADVARLAGDLTIADGRTSNPLALLVDVVLTDGATIPVINVGRPVLRSYTLTVNQRQRRVRLRCESRAPATICDR